MPAGTADTGDSSPGGESVAHLVETVRTVERSAERDERLRSVIPLAREAWIGPPPWLTACGRGWWLQSAERSSRHRTTGAPGRGLIEGGPLMSLVITMVTVGVMMVMILGVSFAGQAAGGTGKAAVAAEGSITVWLPTIVSMYVLSSLLSVATRRRKPFDDDPPGAGAFGLADNGPGLLASNDDRLWTLERLEAAESHRALSAFGFGALSVRTLSSRRIEELYAVLVDAVRYPDADQVDRAIAEAMHAVVEGRITEEELSPFFDRIASEGTPESLTLARAAYAGRPASDDREQRNGYSTRQSYMAGSHPSPLSSGLTSWPLRQRCRRFTTHSKGCDGNQSMGTYRTVRRRGT